MGQQASAPPPELPLPRASAWLRKETLTGHLLRHVPRWRRSLRWAWHEAVLDIERFQTTTWPEAEERDSVPLGALLGAEAVALAAPRALFTPAEVKAKAPEEEATPAGFLLHIKGGNELLLCARSVPERQRWLDAFNLALEQLRALDSEAPEPASGRSTAVSVESLGSSLAESAAAAEGPATPKASPAAKLVVEQSCVGASSSDSCCNGPGKGGGKGGGPPGGPPGGAGKGKGKGKGKPAGPPPKGAATPKGGLPPKAPGGVPKRPAVPKIHGLVQKDPRAPKETANTIFHCTGSTPRPCYDLNAFVASGQAAGAKARKVGAAKAQEDRTRLLDDKLAQAVGVAMARLDAPAVVAAVEALDPSFGGQRERLLDGAENLHDVLAGRKDRDPLGRIHEYLQRGGEAAALRSIEQSLLPLAQVPRAAQRLQLILLLSTLPDRLDRARRQLGLLLDTARDVEKSKLLKEVVRIIQVAMAWNTGGGQHGGGQHVFNVGEQLERLKTIKPPGSMGGRTFVHWMAEELMLRCGWPLGPNPFASEVPTLQQAAKTNPALVYEELQRVQQGSRLAASEFEEHFCAYSLLQPPLSAAAGQAAAERPAAAPAPSELPTSLRAAEPVSEPAAKPPAAGESTEGGQSGPQEFRLSSGFDSLPPEPGDCAGFEAFNLEAPCGRPTELCGRPALAAAPRPPPASSWDTRRIPKGVRIRKLAFSRPGTFAKAARSAAAGPEALLGGPPEASAEGAEACLEGFIYILIPHKTRHHRWERCWADLRAHHLVVRRANGRSLGREAALPLPGAEVVPLDCLFASELAGWLASQRVCGFELRGLAFDSGGRHGGPLVARVEGAAAAERWERALRAEAQHHGAGALWVHGGGRSGRWERRWCVCDFEAKRLSCFARPGEHVLGQEPRRVVPLGDACLRSLDKGSLGSAPAGGVGGFEIQESHCAEEGDASVANGAGRITSFVAESPEALKRWLAALQAVCVTASLRNSYCAPLDLGDTPPGRPWDEAGSSGEESPFAMFARQRPSFAQALRRSSQGPGGPKCVDLLAACEAAVAAEAAAAAEVEVAATEALGDQLERGEGDVRVDVTVEGDAALAPGAALGLVHQPGPAAPLPQGEASSAAGPEGTAPATAAEPTTPASPAAVGTGASAPSTPSPQRQRVPPLALSPALRGDLLAAGSPSAPSMSEASFGSTDSETGTFKTAASARSVDSDDYSTEEEEEPGVVGRLRRLGGELKAESSALEESLKAGECAARTTLRFFDEEPSSGSALAELQAFLGHIANFARDFGSAVEEVSRREETKAKAQAKVDAKAQLQALSPSKRRVGRPGRAAAAPPQAAELPAPAPAPEGQREPRREVVTQPAAPVLEGRRELRKEVVTQPMVPVHVGGS